MQVFLFTILYGIFAGVVFTLNGFIKRVFKNNIIVTIILDFISTIISGIIFIYCIFTKNCGIIRMYEVAGFLAGIITELVSIGKFVDFLLDLVYKYIIKCVKWLDTHTKRRAKPNGTNKIK